MKTSAHLAIVVERVPDKYVVVVGVSLHVRLVKREAGRRHYEDIGKSPGDALAELVGSLEDHIVPQHALGVGCGVVRVNAQPPERCGLVERISVVSAQCWVAAHLIELLGGRNEEGVLWVVSARVRVWTVDCLSSGWMRGVMEAYTCSERPVLGCCPPD